MPDRRDPRAHGDGHAAGGGVVVEPDPMSVCAECRLRARCLPCDLVGESVARFAALVRHEVHAAGARLWTIDAPLSAITVIRGGAVIDHARTGRVLGINLPGAVLGLDALVSTPARSSPLTLDTTAVCVIPVASLLVLARVPPLQTRLHALLADQAARLSDLLALHDRPAETRVARWLLELARAFQANGYAADAFTLPVARADIGSYLGLALETVSRSLSRLESAGVIAKTGRRVRIMNRDALHALAHPKPRSASVVPLKQHARTG